MSLSFLNSMVFSSSIKVNCKKCGAVTFPYFGTDVEETKPNKELYSKELSQIEASNNKYNKVKRPIVRNSGKNDDQNIENILNDFVEKYPFVGGLIHLDKIKDKKIKNKKSSKIQTQNSGNNEITDKNFAEFDSNRIQEKKANEIKITNDNEVVETWRCKNCSSADIVKNSF